MKPHLVAILLGTIAGILVYNKFPSVALPLLLISLFLFVFFQIAPRIHSIFKFATLSLVFLVAILTKKISENSSSSSYTIHELSNRVCYGEILQTKINPSGYRTFQIEIDQANIREKSTPTHFRVVLISKTKLNYQEGNRIALKADFQGFENNPNPGAFDAKYYYQTHDFQAFAFVDESCLFQLEKATTLRSYFARWRNGLSDEFDRLLSPRVAGIAKALLLGTKSGLDQDIMQSFANTGAMHVLAVSGLHIGILLLIIQRILNVFQRFISKKQILILSLLIIWVFTFLSGASPSVLRSTFMFTILSFGFLINRKSNGFNALAISAILLLFYDPNFIYDLGFQLSYAALIGIFVFEKRVSLLFTPKNKYIQWLWNGTSVGIAATITTTPLVLYYTHQFPNYFLLSNLLVMLLGFILLLLLLIYLTVARIPYLQMIVAFLCTLFIQLLIFGIDWIDKLPGAVSNGFVLDKTQVIGAYIILGLFIWNRATKNKRLFNWLAVFSWVILLNISRMQSQNQDQLVLFSDNAFCGMIQIQNSCYFIYDEREEIRRSDQYIRDFTRYSGTQCIRHIPLKSVNEFRLGGQTLHISSSEKGWKIDHAKRSYEYYSKKMPPLQTSPLLMNKRIYVKLFRKQPNQIFRLSI